MKKALLIIIVIVLVVGAIFFIPSRLSHIEDDGGDKQPAGTLGRLQSKSWEWVSASYGDGTVHAPRQPGQFELTLASDGRFSARTDCNSTGGNYVADEYMITFSDIVSTKMYCEGSVENDFVKVLTSTQSYFFTDTGELVFDFKFDSGSAVFK